MNKTVALFGSTGLIGGEVLKLLINDDNYETINVITRKKVTVQSKKIKNYIIDFTNPDGYKKVIKKGDVVIASIGTTQSKVNWNKDEYRKVDYDININIAKACKKFQIQNFSFVSTAGANYKSDNFYLKLKGEIEKDIISMNLPSTSIYRPSLLLGERKERRIGEKVAQFLMPKLSFLMPEKYKPINAKNVALSMINISKSIEKRHKLYHYKEIIENS